ncbi:MAG: hypothetical protein ACK5TR_08215 [Alphaproteobacteria bacterium]|nr:hypothetical protein [Alphaproteobacteria bacterium]
MWDGADIVCLQGGEVHRAGKRLHADLSLVRVTDQLRHVWTYSGPLIQRPYTLLTQGNPLFPYFHAGLTFSKKQYAALRIGKRWYTLKKGDQINFQYLSASRRSRTQKVTALEFAELLRNKSPVSYVITQLKKRGRVVYLAN